MHLVKCPFLFSTGTNAVASNRSATQGIFCPSWLVAGTKLFLAQNGMGIWLLRHLLVPFQCSCFKVEMLFLFLLSLCLVSYCLPLKKYCLYNHTNGLWSANLLTVLWWSRLLSVYNSVSKLNGGTFYIFFLKS